LADDFSKTTIYEENKELAGEVLESLVSSFTTRSNNSDWLSKDGAKAIQEKTDNITSYFYSSDKNENFYNYNSYIGNWTNKLSKELWASNYKSWLMAIESIKNNESINQTYGKISDAFLANAFYMPDENTITITLGYLFSNGGDFRTYSTEELYSSLGFLWVTNLLMVLIRKEVITIKTGKNLQLPFFLKRMTKSLRKNKFK
jgi:hypothetical protein